jgi:hypothetical protein
MECNAVGVKAELPIGEEQSMHVNSFQANGMLDVLLHGEDSTEDRIHQQAANADDNGSANDGGCDTQPIRQRRKLHSQRFQPLYQRRKLRSSVRQRR